MHRDSVIINTITRNRPLIVNQTIRLELSLGAGSLFSGLSTQARRGEGGLVGLVVGIVRSLIGSLVSLHNA